MRASDVTETIELALAASGCDQAVIQHKPRLLSYNGSCYISGDLAEWLEKQKMEHVRGSPFHPQTQGKIERWLSSPNFLCRNLIETEDRIMARKRYSDEDILKLLRKIEVHLYDGMDVISACRKAGISDKTYYGWRKKFGAMGRSQLSEMKSLQKENDRLKKIVAELELDKLILKESLDFLKPKD